MHSEFRRGINDRLVAVRRNALGLRNPDQRPLPMPTALRQPGSGPECTLNSEEPSTAASWPDRTNALGLRNPDQRPLPMPTALRQPGSGPECTLNSEEPSTAASW